jgi:hypothetical protein
LGHIVCEDGLLVDPRKIIIKNMPTSISVIELKRFLDATCFYCQYFRNFIIKTTPMCKLLKKDIQYWWDEACEQSFQWMKTSLTTLLILIVFNWTKEFHVHTYASNYAIGATLIENLDDTIDKPIYYASYLMI